LFKNKGFTLIEVMMAMLILIVGMLGLLQSINLALETNLRNQLREEAVYVGERSMNELRGKGFDNISSVDSPALFTYKTYSVASKIRGTSRKYGVSRSTLTLAKDGLQPVTKQLNILVTWTYKGIAYENRVSAPTSISR
jgi:type IV pilus assembly protein PilV